MDLAAQKEWVGGLGLGPAHLDYALRLFLKLEFCRAEVTHCELRDGLVNVVANGDLLVLGERGRVEWAGGHFNPFLPPPTFAFGAAWPHWWRTFRVADPAAFAEFTKLSRKGGE